MTFDAHFGRSKKSTCGYKSGLMSIAFNATASLIRSSTRPSNSQRHPMAIFGKITVRKTI